MNTRVDSRAEQGARLTIWLYLRAFLRYSGSRLLILVGIIVVAGVLDGIGIALFLPLLDLSSSSSNETTLHSITTQVFQYLNIDPSLGSLLILLCIAFGLKGVFLFLQNATAALIGTGIAREVRIDLVRHYGLLDYLYYTNLSTGYLSNLVSTESERLVGAFQLFANSLAGMVYVLIYVALALMIAPQLTIFVLGISAVVVVFLRPVMRYSRILSIGISRDSASMQHMLIQTIRSIPYLKATERFEPLFEHVRAHVQGIAAKDLRVRMVNSTIKESAEPLGVLFLSALIFYQVALLEQPLSQVIILALVFYRTLSRVLRLQVDWQKFNGALGGFDMIERAKVSMLENLEQNNDKIIPSARADIRFDNVGVRFGESVALDSITMTIPKNANVAIVGQSGAGKTTIFKVLTGLIKPTSGTYSVDGENVDEIDKRSLRKYLGYVPQDPVVFDDSIANNISFWDYERAKDQKAKADVLERIIAAAAFAHCDTFIERLENGVETQVGDQGVKLSGGQRQRLAIARELYRNPDIIIFDEATSSLDSDSERVIQASIEELKGRRTLVTIAHRLSTVRNCDTIFVLNEGRLVEQGSFGELIARNNGLFQRMCVAQNIDQ